MTLIRHGGKTLDSRCSIFISRHTIMYCNGYGHTLILSFRHSLVSSNFKLRQRTVLILLFTDRCPGIISGKTNVHRLCFNYAIIYYYSRQQRLLRVNFKMLYLPDETIARIRRRQFARDIRRATRTVTSATDVSDVAHSTYCVVN